MSSQLEQRCFERGIKLTEQRRVIARVLGAADGHPDVEEVYRRASRLDEQISLATVYRTLRLFEEAGLVLRRDHGDGRARYEGGWEPRDAPAFDVQGGAAAGLRQGPPGRPGGSAAEGAGCG